MNKSSLILLGCAALLMSACSRDSAREPLPVQHYLNSAASLDGHVYSLTARVESQAGADDKGSLLVVSPLDGSAKLPLYVPASLAMRFSPEQRIVFTLKVSGGILHVTAANKQ